MDQNNGSKRKRDDPDPPWRRHPNDHERHRAGHQGKDKSGKSWSHSNQNRMNQLQEEERHREFIAQEGKFVIKQKRKAAEIRVKEGRALPIDWLTVNLRIIDPTRDLIDDDIQDEDLDFVNPDSVFDQLSEKELSDLRKGIEDFIDIETDAKPRDYWRTMRIICKDQQRKLRAYGPEGRVVSSVSSDIDKLLGPKSFTELEKLETQIRDKLDSDEPVDTDYWQQLLDHLLVYKAKAKVRKVYKTVLDSRLKRLRQENFSAAKRAEAALPTLAAEPLAREHLFDPRPLLQVDSKDRALVTVDEDEFLRKIDDDRQHVIRMGFVPLPKTSHTLSTGDGPSFDERQKFKNGVSMFEEIGESHANNLFDREVAKGVEEDEEVFAGEEEVETKNTDVWVGKYRPRKPKYFNRVQLGYEWNKYNQTHYDHDNPPPKVVQGYKFHVFYPDLIDKTKAPTYKIIREGGRKKGQTLAPAGEEDTCIIRFMSGPPYEDIAFRIVDRDWDYSAKHERGFKSTFEKGILTLHFSFKKIYYRK